MNSWTEQGKPRRQSRDATRKQVLDRAIDVITEVGLRVSLEHLNLEALIREVGAPRTSVYRLWPTKEDFLTDLLVEIFSPEGRGLTSFDAPSLAHIQASIEQAARTSGHVRAKTVREVIRLGVRENFARMSESIGWQTYVAASLSLNSFPDQHRETVESVLKEMQIAFIARMSSYYQELLNVVDLKLRKGVTTEHLAVVGSTLLEGLAQRRRLLPGLIDAPVSIESDIDSECEEWHLAALSFMGIVDEFLEPGWDN